MSIKKWGLVLNKILVVGFGGFLGAALRYVVSLYCVKWFGGSFPVGTLLVNVAGGLLMGFLMEIGTNVFVMPENVRIFLTTGILGGLTTFSTFSYETVSLFNDGEYVKGGLNVGVNLTLALAAVCAGKFLAGLIKQPVKI